MLVCGNATLYNEDSKNIGSLLENVDAVISDPPYGINYKSPSGKGMTYRGDYPVIEGDDKEFDPSWLLNCKEVVLFGANHFANKLPNSAAWLVWDKRCGLTSNNNSDCELAWKKTGGSARLVSHLWNGMLKDSEQDQRRVHPTQKPIAVMEWVIKQCNLPPGSTILDPYMGSGTTGIAALKLGYKFIGVEIDKKYFEVAFERILNCQRQNDMFAMF